MPESPSIFGIFKCKTCIPTDPYLPLIGAAYFSVLLSLSLLFPKFPNLTVARGGLIGSFLVALFLTLYSPYLCIACCIGHVCNILIWFIWWKTPPLPRKMNASSQERIFLTLMAPAIIVTLFCCLNLTFLSYHLKTKQEVTVSGLRIGDILPSFRIPMDGGLFLTKEDLLTSKRTILNFVSPNCPFCKEQLEIINDISEQFDKTSYQFINITSSPLPDLIALASTCQWIIDKENNLLQLFKIAGYPTLFVIDEKGEILQVVAGIPEKLKHFLIGSLKKNPA